MPRLAPHGAQAGEHLGAHREVAVALGQRRGALRELQRLVDRLFVEARLALEHQAQRELAIGAQFARQLLGLQRQGACLQRVDIGGLLGLGVQAAQAPQTDMRRQPRSGVAGQGAGERGHAEGR
jgi:hypothetical protein